MFSILVVSGGQDMHERYVCARICARKNIDFNKIQMQICAFIYIILYTIYSTSAAPKVYHQYLIQNTKFIIILMNYTVLYLS